MKFGKYSRSIWGYRRKPSNQNEFEYSYSEQLFSQENKKENKTLTASVGPEMITISWLSWREQK